MSATPGQAASGPKPPPLIPPSMQAGAFHYNPSSVLTGPVVTPYPDAGAVQIAYDDGSWDWATDVATARANAAAWAEVAGHLEAMTPARKATAA